MKKLFQISSGFSGEKGKQTLAICIGEKHFCFAIANPSGNSLYQLVYYSMDETNESSLMTFFADHPELNDVYAGIFVSYVYPQSVLLPFELYKNENASVLLNSLYGVNGRSTIVSEPINEWQLYNIYATPKEVHEFINQKFPSAKYFHNYSMGVKNIKQADEAGKIWIDFRTDDFTLIAAKENKLLLAQTFLYSTPNDVVYYILKVCRQFSFSQQEVKIILSGLIEKQSALFRELYQYFLNIEFRDADWDLNGNKEYPVHFFTSLNDLAKCVL